MKMFGKRLIAGATLALAISAATPPALPAQQTRADSLEARIRELEARLDSLLAALAQGERADTAVKTAADELEALRAAARAAAGEQPAQDTVAAQSRTRNLSILNPEISVTGDVIGQYLAPGVGDDLLTAVPREFEFGYESALDPYTRTKIFIAYEQEFEIAGYPSFGEDEEEDGHAHGAVHVEEGYLYWVGLPVNLGLKVGRFRQQIGLYNRWHMHALPEIDYPLAMIAFLGGDGLIGTGLSAVAPVLNLGPTTNTLTVEVARGGNEALFDAGKQMSFLANLQNFWDLSPASYLQVAASGVYGENDDEGLVSRLLEVDISYRWRPPGRGMYRDLRLAAEYYWAEKDFGSELLKGSGGFLQANYRLSRRWVVGVRGDYLDWYGSEPDVYGLVPTITWWQSEWVFLRLQYNFVKPDGGDPGHTFTLQTVWALGPHKHEAY
jgi:hypothetical protein